MPDPLITLTTDFGTSDHFVGIMKGVIARISPAARVIDITHEIAPYAITEAAFTIAQACRYYPPKTIHVIVVDPGVGSTRRPILAELAGQYFVAPDNGVLSMIQSQQKPEFRHITSDRYFLKPVSATFHGRDIFAPVAAHLAKGVPASDFGEIIEDEVRLASVKPQKTGNGCWMGTVLKVDRFGNLITNFHSSDFPQITTLPFAMRLGSVTVDRLASTFSDAAPGELFVVIGSSGYLEVALNQSSAASKLDCRAGAPITLIFE